jgi:hypothetical protein
LLKGLPKSREPLPTLQVVSRNKIKSGETKELHMQRCIQVYEQTRHKTKFLWLECYEDY